MKKFWLLILTLLAVFCLGACGDIPSGDDNAPTTYKITLQQNIAEAGSVSGGGEYEKDDEVMLTATTNAGYTFLGWYVSGEQISTEETYVFTATEKKTFTAMPRHRSRP